MPTSTVEFMYADGPLVVGGVPVHRRRPSQPAAASLAQVALRCVVESDGYHAHFYRRDRFGHDVPAVEVIHDFMSWDLDETEPCDPVIVGRHITSAMEPRSAFESVEAAFAALLPGVAVPAVACKEA